MENGSSKQKAPSGSFWEFDPKVGFQTNKLVEKDSNSKNVANNLLSGVRSYKRRYPGQSVPVSSGSPPINVVQGIEERTKQTHQLQGRSTPDTSVTHSDTAANSVSATSQNNTIRTVDQSRITKRLLEKQWIKPSSSSTKNLNQQMREHSLVNSATFNKNLHIQVIPLTAENMAAVDAFYPKNRFLAVHDSLGDHPILLKQRAFVPESMTSKDDISQSIDETASRYIGKPSNAMSNQWNVSAKGIQDRKSCPISHPAQPQFRQPGKNVVPITPKIIKEMESVQPKNKLLSLHSSLCHQPLHQESSARSQAETRAEKVVNTQYGILPQAVQSDDKETIGKYMYQQNPYIAATTASNDTLLDESKHRHSIGTLTDTDLKISSSSPSSPRQFPFDEKDELSPKSRNFLPPVLSIEFYHDTLDSIQSPILSPVGSMKMRRDAEMRERLKGLTLSSPIDIGDSFDQNKNIDNKLGYTPKAPETAERNQRKVGLPPKVPTYASQNEAKDKMGTKTKVVVVRKVKKKTSHTPTHDIKTNQQRLISEKDVEIKRMETRLAELKLMREIQLLEKELNAVKAIAEFGKLTKADTPQRGTATPKQCSPVRRGRVSVTTASIPDLAANPSTPSQTKSKSVRGSRTFAALDRYNNTVIPSNSLIYSKNKISYLGIPEVQECEDGTTAVKVESQKVAELLQSPKRSPQRAVALNKKVQLMKSVIAQQQNHADQGPQTPSIRSKKYIATHSPSKNIEYYR
jgi:hypothetical protein